MNPFVQAIFNLLIQPPGNLTYHAVVAFSVAGTLQAALNNWRSSQIPQGKRMVIGLSLLLAIRLSLFILGGLAWQGILNEHLLMPPIDRAATLFGLILILWMWGFPEPSRWGDAATWLLVLLGITGLTLDLVWWMEQGSTLNYNGSWPDFVGEIASIAVIVIGALILIRRKPNGWGFGLSLFGLALIGHASYLALPPAGGDYAGVVRLSEMAYYPLLLFLPQRFPIPTQEAPRVEAPPERRRTAIEPHLLETFLALASDDSPNKVCQSITQVISTSILADICLLFSAPNESGEVILACGYDLIREVSFPGASLSGKTMPLLATAVTRGLPLRLPSSSTSEDLRTLGNTLHLERPGHLLAVPIHTSQGKPLAAIVLLSPHSNRPWTQEDQALLTSLAPPMAQLLQRTQSLASLQYDLRQAQQELQVTHQEVEKLRKETADLQFRSQELQDESEKNRMKAESLAAIIATQAGPPAASPAEGLHIDGPKLRSILRETDAPPVAPDFMEGELRMALEEVARLKAAQSDADQRVLALKNQLAGENPPDEHYEEIATIVQEMRQPISSIIGYSDFLLGESVGILGALQHKFLERIKMLTERMNRLVTELTRLTATQISGAKSFGEDGVDLYAIVEGAISESMQGLRAKGINLHLDVAENLPTIQADDDAMRQVLVNLIENAREVTPANGEVALRASLQGSEHQQSYVLVQIADQGGGIPPDYIPRVFSRFGYADGKPIPGTGGKSSHLSVVKMLVENSAGRIWVDSQENIGATFSILLPVAEVAYANDEPGGLLA